MTNIVAKVSALVSDARREYPNATDYYAGWIALYRAIEQHEAFKQKVSDAAKVYNEVGAPMGWEGFDQFIIPKPKPDPLVETLKNMDAVMERLEAFRAALEALEIEIREKGQ
jgi:hypothetical protein